ncbi:uncharacterized protein TNCV_2778531 [Trichonephila clavipes]|nr:uncharacterized protein TNCV_2778531 [Trichonephila clavipes]
MIENWVTSIESLRNTGLTPSGPAEGGRSASPCPYEVFAFAEFGRNRLQMEEKLSRKVVWQKQCSTLGSTYYVFILFQFIASAGGWSRQTLSSTPHMTVVAEGYRYRNVADFVMSSSPVPLKDSPCRAAMNAKSVESGNVLPLGDRFNSCQVIYSQFGLAIHQNDHQARRRFVEWAQNEIAVVPDFHKRILFSDEVHFWLNGYVNKQNCRIWSEANPQVYDEKPSHPEKLTVWCALWAGGIIGPYFFKNNEGHNVTVHGDRYRAKDY